MSDRTKLGLAIIGAALTLGIAADLLLRALPWGLNAALWTAGLAAALVLLGRRRNESLTNDAPKNNTWKGGGAWLLAAVIGFSGAFAWHDSDTLALLNVLAILIALALLVLRARGGLLWPAGLIDYAGGAALAAANAAIGPLLVLFDYIRWTEIFTRRSLRRTVAAGAGLLIACPALLIFGGLLASADPVFKGMLARLLGVISWSALSHVLLAGFVAWIVSGFLRGFLPGPPGLLGPNPTLAAGRTWSFPKLGIIEIGVALGALDLLFLAFVLVQVRYLFGGAKLVNVTSGLTYAEYARSGFFELVAVATMSLPLLLLAHWLLNQEDPRHRRVFGGLAGLQIALLFVIMASAFQRMRLYQSEYGMTEARLYPTAFMGWLAVVFVWFALTALRGRRERFAGGALVAGFALITALHVADPDRLIARVNTQRAASGRRFDAWYNGSLSADAVPVLIEALPRLSAYDRCVTAQRLRMDFGWPPVVRGPSPGWRSWNLARARAWRSVGENWQAVSWAARSAVSTDKNQVESACSARGNAGL